MAGAEEAGGEDSGANNELDQPESDSDIAKRWTMELEAAQKGPYRRWIGRAKKAIKRFRDEDTESASEEATPRRNAQFNVLWSNINTTSGSIYSRPPKPIAERRYLDRDVVGRAAATIVQRGLTYVVEDSGLHDVMKQARLDYQLVGMGSVWVRYEAEHENVPDGTTESANSAGDAYAKQDAPSSADNPEAAAVQQQIKTQRMCADYCHWSDELFGPARYWGELPWRAKRAFYTRRELRRRFPKIPRDILQAIPLQVTRQKKGTEVTDAVREAIGKAAVWQIWDLLERKVIYLAHGFSEATLGVEDDELKIKDFIPSPKPVRATTTNDALYPIPDYSIWYDQAAELDSLTARIAALTRAIKVVGTFDSSFPELKRIFEEGMENQLIGVSNWAKLSQKGGIEGSISLLPIKDMAVALTALYQARQQVKGDLYEISGVSDIVRGAGDPNETATAQKLKGQFANVRGGERQQDFNAFVRDTLAIMGEIMVEQYTAETLYLISDFEQWAIDQELAAYAPEMPQLPPAIGHNGGPPLDMPGAMPQIMPQQQAPASLASPPPSLMPPSSGPAALSPQAGPMPQVSQPPAGAMPMGGAQQAPAGPAVLPQGMTPPPGAGMQPPPAPKMTPRELFDKALELLRDDKLRSFRIQVETDSTIEPDRQMDQMRRTEFLTATTQFLASAGEMSQTFPQLMPVLGKMLLFGVRGFRVGRDLESSLETLVADLEKQSRNPQPKPPSPEEIKAKSEQQKGEMKIAEMQMKGQQQQAEFKLELQRMQAELQNAQQMMQLKLQELQMKLEAQRETQALKVQGAQQDAAIQERKGQQELALDAQQGQMDEARMYREDDMETRRMERDEQHEQRSMERAEEHEGNKMALAEKAAAAKAKQAGSGGNGAKRA